MTLRSHSERLMGTTITISLVDEQADIFLQKSFDLLKELEYRFNANSQESELMEINYQAGISPVTVHPDLFELISLGLEHSLALSSHLNISIGPLIQTWRIGFSDAKVAQPQEIESVLPLINPHGIELDSSTSTVFLKQIWTTRLFGERPASILWQVESLEGIEVILIDKEGHLSCSSGIPTL